MRRQDESSHHGEVSIPLSGNIGLPSKFASCRMIETNGSS